MHCDLLLRYHRRLKLRTEGGQPRVRELGSIDLFVVTSLKMNQLSPNLEHKLTDMYGILAANFFVIWYALPVLLWPPVSWLANGHCNMLLVFRSFFRRLISEVSWPIVTKLYQIITCSMVTVVYKIGLEIWGPPPHKNWWAKNITILARFRTSSQLDLNISGLEQDIINRKTALNLRTLPCMPI